MLLYPIVQTSPLKCLWDLGTMEIVKVCLFNVFAISFNTFQIMCELNSWDLV